MSQTDEIGVNRVESGSLELAVQRAYDAMDAGRYEDASALASALVVEAESKKQPHIQAKALYCAGHCDRMLSRFRGAQDYSQRAAHMFRLTGDVSGEVSALTTVAHASANLGRNEDAVEAALLGVRLAEYVPVGPQLAISYNYLGVAYLWSHNFDLAHAALDAAIEAANRCIPSLNRFQPLWNHCWAEVLRHVVDRYHDKAEDTLAEGGRLARRFVAAREYESVQSLIPGGQLSTNCVWQLSLSIYYSWTGKLDSALVELHEAQSALKPGQPNWMDAFAAWARTEFAWASGDLGAASRLATEMVNVCASIEYEQLACVGHLIASQLWEIQGKPERALQELRDLRQRERRMRTESIKSRERVVQWQLDMRSSEASLQSLEAVARHHEQLSLEDPLTGIANRRSFERRVAALLRGHLAERGPRLSIALVDVDQFKQINDRYSHQVGDQVLKTISSLLTSSMREHDLAARLGGDEFVAAFRHADALGPAQFCERLCSTVRDFDWSSVVAGLQVSISVGVAEALPEDTVEALLHRSDAAMYAFKQASRPSIGAQFSTN
jgi:diguanylate cyclase (GGDEF)-like protein